jgi:hypothetical protein
MNDGLTDEERAALELDDNGDATGTGGDGSGGGVDAGGAGAATDAGAGAGSGGAASDGAGTGAAGAGDAAGAGAGADAGGAGGADGAGAAGDGNGAGNGAGAGEGAGATDAQPRPVFVAEAPEGAETRLKEIGDKKAELRKQYDDGDITFDEYDSAKDSLSTEERQLERRIDQANIAASMQQQQAKNEWESTVGSFLDANDVYKNNPVLYRAQHRRGEKLLVQADPRRSAQGCVGRVWREEG